MPNPAVLAHAPLRAAPPLRQTTDSGLEKLVGGDAEEIGDFIQVGELQFVPFASEKLADPRLVMADPISEGGLGFLPRRQQRADVVADHERRFHRRFARYRRRRRMGRYLLKIRT